jgi:hypothetical protein
VAYVLFGLSVTEVSGGLMGLLYKLSDYLPIVRNTNHSFLTSVIPENETVFSGEVLELPGLG